MAPSRALWDRTPALVLLATALACRDPADSPRRPPVEPPVQTTTAPPSGAAPVVRFRVPGEGARALPGAVLEVLVEATDPDGVDPRRLELTWLGLLAEAPGAPDHPESNGLAALSLTLPFRQVTERLGVTATDPDGLATTASLELAIAGRDEDRDGFVAREDGGKDCDDTDPEVHPEAAERCGDGVDNDCDGAVDDTAPDAPGWFRDADRDAFGDLDHSTRACTAPPEHVADSQDCDDQDPLVHPGAPELCDPLGIDHDCDGLVDEDDPDVLGVTTWYPDRDQDQYGDPAFPVDACLRPPDHTRVDEDCDDGDAAINPGAPEICNGRDDDCDGLINEHASDALEPDDHAGEAVDLGPIPDGAALEALTLHQPLDEDWIRWDAVDTAEDDVLLTARVETPDDGTSFVVELFRIDPTPDQGWVVVDTARGRGVLEVGYAGSPDDDSEDLFGLRVAPVAWEEASCAATWRVEIVHLRPVPPG